MRSAHSVPQVRAAEAEQMAMLPDGALMQRAAYGLAVAVADFLGRVTGRRILLLIGSGDNGGDALYAGALLARRGARVEALLLAPDRAHQGGLAALGAAGGRQIDSPAGRAYDVVLDGIVGIGGSGGLRPQAADVVAQLDGTVMVAVDVPSGVDCDTGRIEGAHVVADLTVTFGTYKIAHLVDPAASACGALHLVDLDLRLPEATVTSLQADDVAALVPRPDRAAHKYTRGVVGLRTGSQRYPGAAVLSTAGANCGLAGLVRYDGSAAAAVVAAHPEVVPSAGRVQTWVVGSGGGEAAEAALAASLADGVPVVVDADALAFVRPGEPIGVLTPHAGELAAMLGQDRTAIEAAPLAAVRDAAVHFGSVVLLKGPHTLVAHPDGRVRANATGTPWLATAGAGDVLAGLIGALLATGLEPFDAASAGAWIHGAAASAVGGPLTASRLAAAIPAVLHELTMG